MFTKRLNLPGIGDISRWRNELPYLIGAGLTMMVITYLAFDRYFYSVSPESYPDLSVYMIFLPIKGAFTDELILRFGLVTIGVGICRNRYGGAVLVAVFATILSFKYLEFAGVSAGMELCLHYAADSIVCSEPDSGDRVCHPRSAVDHDGQINGGNEIRACRPPALMVNAM